MISVVIPVYNQATALEFVLEGFEKQTYIGHFTIIVVDDGSDDDVKSVVEKFDNLDIQYVKQENKGRAAARNTGIKNVTSEFVIFCDADRIPSSNFVQAYYEKLIQYPDCACMGVPKEIYISNYWDKKDKICEVVLKDSGFAKEAYYSKVIKNIFNNEGFTDSSIQWIGTLSGNMGISLKKLKEVDGFDENFVDWGFEHFELGYRLYHNHVRFLRLEEAINYHLPHTRGACFYEKEIKKSHEYFYDKHKCIEVLKLREFMLGNLSLQDYEMVVNKDASWLKYCSMPVYNKIFNLAK